jgi:hypothetical protein
MPQQTEENSIAAGIAALSICESLLLALSENKVLRENEVYGILEDAAATQHGAARASRDDAVHKAASDLIEHLLAERKASPSR